MSKLTKMQEDMEAITGKPLSECTDEEKARAAVQYLMLKQRDAAEKAAKPSAFGRFLSKAVAYSLFLAIILMSVAGILLALRWIAAIVRGY